MEFSDTIKDFLQEEFNSPDIDNMTLAELKQFREKVVQKRQEYTMLELCRKLSGNAAYGASGNRYFPFFNPKLAADITGECRNLTKTIWNNMEEFFHETIWERKDLQEKFKFSLDESKHDWYRQQHVSVYSDTDSVYITYGDLFDCMDQQWHNEHPTILDKCKWVYEFNKEFMDWQSTQWCRDIYEPRHANSVHELEMELINQNQINLAKKKYCKNALWNKGTWYDKPKLKGTGIDIIKTTTPRLCREILNDIIHSLAFDYEPKDKSAYILFLNDKMVEWKRKFYSVPVEDISETIGIGDYKKYVLDDENSLEFAPKAPKSVKAVGRYNYLAHKNHQDNLRMISGKMKYYNIRTGSKKDDIDFFGFPLGELPEWAPKIDYSTQWNKTVVKPLNKFLEALEIPQMTTEGVIQQTLFGW